MARLISRKQVEEVQDFIKDTSFAQSVSISGSLLVSQSFDLGSDPSEKSTITGSVELTGSLTIDGPLNFIGDQSLELTASVALESLDTQLFGGINAADASSILGSRQTCHKLRLRSSRTLRKFRTTRLRTAC